MSDYGQYRYKNPNPYHQQYQRQRSYNPRNTYGHGTNPYPYNSFNLSPTLVLVYLICGLAIIYNLLQQPLGLPPLWLLPVYPFRRMLGRSKQEKIENLFGEGIGLLKQGQGRILSGIGAGAAPPGAGDDWEGWIGGLYNTGNTCYQNCVLQAMASLKFLPGHLTSITSTGSDSMELSTEIENDDDDDDDDDDDATYMSDISPAAEALEELLDTLNTKSRFAHSSTPPRPLRLNPSTNSWFQEQQDAQEFFQKLTGELEKEAVKSWKNRRLWTKNGLKELAKVDGTRQNEESSEAVSEDLKNPFEGLLAQRVGCLRCGYVEAIRMQGFTSLSLALPSSWSCGLSECLQEFTSLETLNGVPCEKCTLLSIKARLERILELPVSPEVTNEESSASTVTPELRDALTLRLARVDESLEKSDFSSERLKACNISSRNMLTTDKSKQIMIARPPLILVLHMNRSMFDLTTGGTRKNYAVVEFNTVLDLEPWIVGNSSGFGLNPSRSMRILGEEKAKQSTRYILRSVVAHYGSHGSGHYVCYRQTYPSKTRQPAPVSEGKETEVSEKQAKVKPKPIWWRCSDCDIRPADEEEVLSAGNAFMLYYERLSIEEAEELAHLFKAESGFETPVMREEDDDSSSVMDDDDDIDGTTMLKSKMSSGVARRKNTSTNSSDLDEDVDASGDEERDSTEYLSDSTSTSEETAATTPSLSTVSSAPKLVKDPLTPFHEGKPPVGTDQTIRGLSTIHAESLSPEAR